MDTIPGGRYLSADGKTYHDANGKTLDEKPPEAPEAKFSIFGPEKKKPGRPRKAETTPETLPETSADAPKPEG